MYYRKYDEYTCGCCCKETFHEPIYAFETELYDGLQKEIDACCKIAVAKGFYDHELKAVKNPNDEFMALLERNYSNSNFEQVDDDKEYDQLIMTQTVYDEQLGSGSEPKNNSAIYAAIAFPAIAGLVIGAIFWKKRATFKR